MKITKKNIALNTLKIIEDGFYEVEGKKIDVLNGLENSFSRTFTVSPESWNELLKKSSENAFDTEMIVKNCSTIMAITEERTAGKIGVLNFASAKNPGGGFLGGASAQEESLARSSNLYATLKKNETMYKFNKSQRTFLYSDYLIYSPDVLFWFDDEGETFSTPLIADVITSPAPNKGAMEQHDRKEELSTLEDVFKNRIENVLQIALNQGVECLILGAWGCGVFRNDPKFVSESFKTIIEEQFPNAFKKIIFAIYDSSKTKKVLTEFNNTFLTKNT